MSELISKRTRRAFADYLAGFSNLREITAYFEDQDIKRSERKEDVGGERRGLAYEYYSSVDWLNEIDVRKALKVFESILNDAVDRQTSEDDFKRLVRLLESDGYTFDHGQLSKHSSSHSNFGLLLGAEVLDKQQITQAFQRIEQSIDTDPEASIGAAKELIETVCKHILDELAVEYAKDVDMPGLVKLTSKNLSLVPDSISDKVKGVEIIKRTLSNLGSVAQSIAELRNLYGTGHGKPKGYKGLSPRHARLAVNSALALSIFLVETYNK